MREEMVRPISALLRKYRALRVSSSLGALVAEFFATKTLRHQVAQRFFSYL